eukprot:2391095-Prymnesium_polylepis.2
MGDMPRFVRVTTGSPFAWKEVSAFSCNVGDDCICGWVKPCALARFVVKVELEVLVRYVHTLARQCVVNRHVVDMQIACHIQRLDQMYGANAVHDGQTWNMFS